MIGYRIKLIVSSSRLGVRGTWACRSLTCFISPLLRYPYTLGCLLWTFLHTQGIITHQLSKVTRSMMRRSSRLATHACRRPITDKRLGQVASMATRKDHNEGLTMNAMSLFLRSLGLAEKSNGVEGLRGRVVVPSRGDQREGGGGIQVNLRQRPEPNEPVTDACFEVKEGGCGPPAPVCAAGQLGSSATDTLFCRTLYLSVDPFLRCRFNERCTRSHLIPSSPIPCHHTPRLRDVASLGSTGVDYTQPYAVGAPISSAGIGQVLFRKWRLPMASTSRMRRPKSVVPNPHFS